MKAVNASNFDIFPNEILFQNSYLGWLRRVSETIQRHQVQPQQTSQCWHSANTHIITPIIIWEYPKKIKPYRSVDTRHTRDQIMWNATRGNSFSYHFVDVLLFFSVANSVPLAKAHPCPVLFPPCTDRDASSSTNALTIGLVCECWMTQCFLRVTDVNTHSFTYVCVSVSVYVSGRAVFWKQMFCAAFEGSLIWSMKVQSQIVLEYSGCLYGTLKGSIHPNNKRTYFFTYSV